MEDDVRQRIRCVLELKHTNITAISKEIGLKQNTLSRQINGDTTISVNTLLSIIGLYPDINSDWLITGKGEMLKPVTPLAPGSIAIGGNASGIVNNGSVAGSIHGHSVKNGNVVGDNNNIGIMPSDCERALVKAKAEIDILKKKVKESESKIKNIEAQSKNRIEEITRQYDQEKESLKNQLEQAFEERNRSLVDKDRALAMLEKALSK